MRFADILKMCFDSLSRRKGRTILTVLGVFIGCTSIIVMVSIGAGMQESYDQMLKNMGDLSIIEVYRGYNQNTGTQTESKLDEKAVESFHEIAGVQAVMPKASLDNYNISFKAGINDRYSADWGNFAGIDVSALEDMGYELVAGRYPESSDEVVVGQYFAYNFKDTLMPDGRNYVDRYTWDENGNIDTENVPDPFFDPLKTDVKMLLTSWDDSGNETTPYSVDLKVVGILKEDQGKGYETSEGVMMDINALKALIQDLTGKTDTKFEYSSINVKAESLEAVPRCGTGHQGSGLQHLFHAEPARRAQQADPPDRVDARWPRCDLASGRGHRHHEHDDHVHLRAHEGDRHYEGARVLCARYPRDVPDGGGQHRTSRRRFGAYFQLHHLRRHQSLLLRCVRRRGVTWELIKQALIGGENVTRVSVIKPELIIFALVFSVLVGLVSGYQPANKAVKISALEAIRNE